MSCSFRESRAPTGRLTRPPAVGRLLSGYPIGYTAVKRNPLEDCMRVVVDYDLCESNAVCVRLVPEVFEVRDDDRLRLKQERPPEGLRARVEEAVRRCPKQALSLVER
jgi:ferredoxin